MPASFEVVSPGMVAVSFVWSGADELGIPIDKGTEIVENAALYDHRRGLGPTVDVDGETVQKPWEDLSNQEKLDMTFQAATRLLKAQAETALYDTNIGVAREDTADYIDEEYGDFE